MTDAPLEDAMTDPQPLTEHPAWHESGCVTCSALDPLLVALNDLDHQDADERDLIVRLAGGALDAARAASVAPDLRAALEDVVAEAWDLNATMPDTGDGDPLSNLDDALMTLGERLGIPHIAPVEDLRAALAAPSQPSQAAAERLRDAISGERRDWHRVEVSPDDIAALLGSQPSRDALALDVERVEAAIQSAYDAHDDHRTRHPGHAGECQSDWPVPSRLAPLVLARLTAAEESRDA